MLGISSANSAQSKGFCALTSLFETLEEKSALESPRVLSRQAKEELQLFESRLEDIFVYCVDPSLPLS